jgi:hypothetical protein
MACRPGAFNIRFSGQSGHWVESLECPLLIQSGSRNLDFAAKNSRYADLDEWTCDLDERSFIP